MSEVKWTAEQRAAIEARGHTLLVSAAGRLWQNGGAGAAHFGTGA